MRYLGWVDDPTAGGTSLDDLGVDPIDIPDTFVPVQSAQANPGTRTLDRDDDVRNRRAGSAPISFAATPGMTFTSRAWTKLVRMVLRKAMGNLVGNTGVAPASIQSTLTMLQSGNLPAIMPTLVREGQVDQMTGAVFGEVELNFPVDGEGTVECTLDALYHEVTDPGSVVGLPNPAGMPEFQDAYMLRDITAFMGAGAGVAIDCLAGFGLTINNNLVDEFRSRFCAGKNISEQTLETILHRIWYPDRNKFAQQTVTGRLDFGDVRPDLELRRILSHATKLVVELNGPPLAGTVPAADEMARLILYRQVPTGGGAEPLQREGDQVSSYEFTGYLDDGTGKDLEAVLVGDEALV